MLRGTGEPTDRSSELKRIVRRLNREFRAVVFVHPRRCLHEIDGSESISGL